MLAYLQTFKITTSKDYECTHILFVDYDEASYFLCDSPIPEIGNISKGNHKYFLDEDGTDDLIFDLAEQRIDHGTNFCCKCVGILYTDDPQ